MTQQTNPCGCGSLPRTLITGRYAERPSPESSPVVAVSGGRAEAQRSRPERPALSKSAGGPARDCGPPGSSAPREPRPTGCCAGVRSTAGVGSRAGSSPLPSGPPSVRPSAEPSDRVLAWARAQSSQGARPRAHELGAGAPNAALNRSRAASKAARDRSPGSGRCRRSPV